MTCSLFPPLRRANISKYKQTYCYTINDKNATHTINMNYWGIMDNIDPDRKTVMNVHKNATHTINMNYWGIMDNIDPDRKTVMNVHIVFLPASV